MIAALDRFRRRGDVGFLQALERLSGPLDDPATWGNMMQSGTPAIYVHYGGTTFDKIYGELSGNDWEAEDTFSAICLANDFGTRIERLEGGRSRFVEPGLDAMTKIALYYIGNELSRKLGKLQRFRPTSIRYLAYEDVNFISVISFSAMSFTCFLDDVGTEKLARLGICFDPLNKGKPFKDDNVTPNTNNPTTTAIGYNDLKSGG